MPVARERSSRSAMSRSCVGISKKNWVTSFSVSALSVPPVTAVVSENGDAPSVRLPRKSMCSCACAVPVTASSSAPAR